MCDTAEPVRIDRVLPSSPTLTTDRPGLLLTPLTSADAENYYAALIRNGDHLTRFGDYRDEQRATLEWVVGYFRDPPDANIRFGIRLAGRLIGRVDLNPVDPPRYSIGYWLDHAHTGHGYATLACAAAIEYARTELGATDIYAGVTHGNEPSVRVLTRLGFRPVTDFPAYRRYHLRLADA